MANNPTRAAVAVLATLLLAGALSEPAAAQTDFYNLDKHRPLRVEDAYATKRGAFEFQLSPLTLVNERFGNTRYQPSIELKHGLLPGVEVSVGNHLDVHRRGADTEVDFGSIELSALANLWVESEWLPAAGIRATAHLPTDGDHDSSFEIRGLLTRTLRGPVRAHLTGGGWFGDGRAEEWWLGLALDYVLPFQHTLLLAETWVAESASDSAGPFDSRTVHSTAGFRTQLSPTLALDAGVGRGWSGDDRDDWQLTLGVTYEFAIRSLMHRRTP